MRILCLGAVAACLTAAPALAQNLKADEIFSSISVRPLAEPNPVRGAGGGSVVDDDEWPDNGAPATVTDRLRGSQVDRMPLNNQVADFGPPRQ